MRGEGEGRGETRDQARGEARSRRRESARAPGRLTAAADCEFLLGMRWFTVQLRALLLVVLALVVAGQALARVRSLLPSTATAMLLEDLQLTICSVHGVMALGPDGLPAPAPDPEHPACPWCGLSTGQGPQLPYIAAVPIGVLTPPRQLHAAMAASAPCPLPPRRAWAACSPRAPPDTASA